MARSYRLWASAKSALALSQSGEDELSAQPATHWLQAPSQTSTGSLALHW
jgi:hypothetical protein